MPHFEFALNEVLDVATHTMVAPHNTLRATYDQCQNEDDVHAALWWVRDRSGTYLTGNSTHPGAPRDAFAHGYGPDGDDASAILGADDRVIDAIPLHDPKTEQCLHSDLIRAHRNGHNTLTITMKHNATEVRTHRADVPIAPSDSPHTLKESSTWPSPRNCTSPGRPARPATCST